MCRFEMGSMPSQLRPQTSRRYNGPDPAQTTVAVHQFFAISKTRTDRRQSTTLHTRQLKRWKLPRPGNSEKNQKRFFSLFPQLLENSPLIAASFPQFPPLLRLALIIWSFNKAGVHLLFFLKQLETSPRSLRVSQQPRR